MPTDELRILSFRSPAAWEKWLAGNHAKSPGVWIKIAKKAAGTPSVTYAEALDGALCYGWIDGLKNPLDAYFWLQRFTPRRARSKWSKINRTKVEALIAASRMRPAGLKEVEAAKADGRWKAAYDSQRSAAVPPDLQRALDDNARAAAFFATLDRVNRYAILYRVQSAIRPETRAQRIDKFIGMLQRREKIHE